MKIRSYLMAVSAAALMAGTAHADPLDFRIANVDEIPNNGQEDVAQFPVLLANEVDDDIIEDVRFEIEIFDGVNGDNAPTGQDFLFLDNITVQIDLGDYLTASGSGPSSLDIHKGTDTGGQVGGNWTNISPDGRFLEATVSRTAGRSTIGFALNLDINPVLCSAKSDYEFVVKIDAFTDNGVGAPIAVFGGGAERALLKCADGVVATVVDDSVGDNLAGGASFDSIIDLPTYTTFESPQEDGPFLGLQNFQGVFDEGLNNTSLGWVKYAFNNNAVTAFGLASPDNEYMDETLVDEIKFSVEFDDDQGMSDTLVTPFFPPYGANDFQSIVGNVSTHFIDPDDAADALLHQIFVFADNSGLPMVQQQPRVVDSMITFNRTYLAAEGGDAFCGDGPLDTLERQGRRFGFFDWVGDSSKPTSNIFRITGLSEVEDTEVIITMDNSTSDTDGDTTVSIPATDVVNGTYLIGSDTLLTNEFGMFGVADFHMLFKTRAGDLDVDRLQIDTSGSLNDFGDGSNLSINLLSSERTPLLDGDQELGSE